MYKLQGDWIICYYAISYAYTLIEDFSICLHFLEGSCQCAYPKEKLFISWTKEIWRSLCNIIPKFLFSENVSMWKKTDKNRNLVPSIFRQLFWWEQVAVETRSLIRYLELWNHDDRVCWFGYQECEFDRPFQKRHFLKKLTSNIFCAQESSSSFQKLKRKLWWIARDEG